MGQDLPPTNYRTRRKGDERRLLILVIGFLMVVGPGLIGLIWGSAAALSSALCLLGGSVLIAGLWLMLTLVEKFVTE